MANAPELWYQVIFQPGVVNKLSLIPPYNECTVNFSCNQHIKVFRAWSIFGIYDGTQKGIKIVEYTNRDANIQISFNINAENHMKHGEGTYTILFYVENDEGLSNMYSYLMSTEQDSSNLYLYEINNLKLKAIDTEGEPEEELDNDYLCFTSEQDGSSVGYRIITYTSTSLDININYSYDGKNWTSWDGTSITLNNGQSIYVWNKTNTLSKYNELNNKGAQFNFILSGSISASGNVNSMINFSELTPYCYNSLFYDNIGLKSVKNLKLPATTLDRNCYKSMFYYCLNLTTPPDLPATTLADNCYENMFCDCSSLTTAPDLPATNLADYCYANMFLRCTSLTKAPELPATSLKPLCYVAMFNCCTSLNSIKLSYTGNFSSTYFGGSWVFDVSSPGTFYYNGSDTTRGENGIPTNFEVQTFTP